MKTTWLKKTKKKTQHDKKIYRCIKKKKINPGANGTLKSSCMYKHIPSCWV